MASSAAIRSIAESLGCAALDGKLVSSAATDVEHYFITPIVELADRFRQHRGSRTLRVSDVKSALSAKGVAPLVGYHASYRPPAYLAIPESALLGLGDADVCVRDARAPCPRYPTAPAFEFHWLAVNGAQPRVPENAGGDAPPEVAELAPPPPLPAPAPAVAVIASEAALCEELARFFHETVAARDLARALPVLGASPIVQPLIPYFLRHVGALLARAGAAELERAQELARAIFCNPNVNCEPYAPLFEAVALTLVLAPRILGRNAPDAECALREAGADFLGVVVQRFAPQFPEMRDRVVEKLLMVLFGDGAPRTSQYGAAVACVALGPGVARHHLLPRLPPLLHALRDAAGSSDPQERLEAARLWSALERICAAEIAASLARGGERTVDRKTAEIHSALVEFFGFGPFSAVVHGGR
jgi:transcription initiation factor TFIID subunit 6